MKRISGLCLTGFVMAMCLSCGRGRTEAPAAEETEEAFTVVPDSLGEEEDVVEEARMDELFDDFMFTFIHNRRLQRERVVYPLPRTDGSDKAEMIHKLDCTREFAFMDGDFYTVLYGNSLQIEEQKERSHDRVLVERILLDSLSMQVYDFERRDGKWVLAAIRSQDLHVGELSDFLTFYARFSADSLFQQQSIAQPLSYSMIDSDGDDSYIEGTLDASQWVSFGAEMPRGEITNIRYGQTYNPHHVVMQKCGLADGMQELFTFEKRGRTWRLVAYEN